MSEQPNITGFVYAWYDRSRQMLYVGSHFGSPTDGYICSSPRLKRAYKRRPSHFMRRILYWHRSDDRQALLEKEFEWLRLIPDVQLGKRFYNLYGGKPGHWAATASRPNIGQKISEALKAKNIIPWNKGKTKSPEHLARWKESRKNGKGWEASEEANQKRREKMKGRDLPWLQTPEAIEKSRQSNLGKIPWNKGKPGPISWNKGIPCSEETRAKISATKRLSLGR